MRYHFSFSTYRFCLTGCFSLSVQSLLSQYLTSWLPPLGLLTIDNIIHASLRVFCSTVPLGMLRILPPSRLVHCYRIDNPSWADASSLGCSLRSSFPVRCPPLLLFIFLKLRFWLVTLKHFNTKIIIPISLYKSSPSTKK